MSAWWDTLHEYRPADDGFCVRPCGQRRLDPIHIPSIGDAPMSNTTPPSDTEALAWVLNAVDWPDGMGDDDYSRKQAEAVVSAGWISPTESATRDAAQRAAGAETALREVYRADWKNVLQDKVFQDALLATAGLMETQRITPQCRENRTIDGAWDEAVRRLREIYDIQVSHDPNLTIGLSIGRLNSADRIGGTR